MVRTQIQLREDQAESLRRQAAADGRSVAELIRDAVDRSLESERRDRVWEAALAGIGIGAGPEGEAASEDHDRALADAFEA